MTTVLVNVVRASRMMVIFTASQEERFHRTPMGANKERLNIFLVQNMGLGPLNFIFGLYNIAVNLTWQSGDF